MRSFGLKVDWKRRNTTLGATGAEISLLLTASCIE